MMPFIKLTPCICARIYWSNPQFTKNLKLAAFWLQSANWPHVFGFAGYDPNYLKFRDALLKDAMERFNKK